MKVKIWRWLPFFLLSGAIHAAEVRPLELELEVKSADGRAMLHIGLRNTGTRAVKVPHALATEEEMYGKLFDLRDAATGMPLDYQGIMVKRGPLTDADYLPLAPGASQSNRIDLSRAYTFKPGRHAYTIRYAGHFLDNGKEMPLTAGPVRFEHTGK